MIARREWIEQPGPVLVTLDLGKTAHVMAYQEIDKQTRQAKSPRLYWIQTPHVSAQNFRDLFSTARNTRAILSTFPGDFERVSLSIPNGFPKLLDYDVCYVTALELTASEKIDFRREAERVQLGLEIID